MKVLVRYTLRVNRILFKKFRYIAESEGRSANREIEQFMKRVVRDYESENGEIPVPKQENDESYT